MQITKGTSILAGRRNVVPPSNFTSHAPINKGEDISGKNSPYLVTGRIIIVSSISIVSCIYNDITTPFFELAASLIKTFNMSTITPADNSTEVDLNCSQKLYISNIQIYIRSGPGRGLYLYAGNCV